MSFLATAYIKNLYRLILVGTLPLAFQCGAFYVPDNVQDVFVRNTCLDCHSGAAPSGSLSLDDATTSETSLVSIVANCSTVGDILVEPGDINVSVLQQKLSNVDIACGGVMPPNGMLISSADLTIINDWIISIGPAQQFGRLTLQDANIDINESQAEVVLTVNRELGTQGVVSVDFLASRLDGDSAENGTDFTEVNGTLTFVDGETAQQIIVPLIDDDVFEGTEVFTVQLIAGSESGGAIIGAPMQTKVNIIDDEVDVNPGTFLFSRVSYSVDENIEGGTIEVTVIRSFGESGEVTVNYSTTDSSASSGSDYQSLAGTLVFPEGDKSESFTITILDDVIEESSEFFNLSLTQPTGGADVGSPSSVQFTIIDNDSPPSDDDGGNDGDGDGGGDEDGSDGDGDNSGNSGDLDIVATDDAEFEGAGSFSLLVIFLLGLLFIVRRMQKLSI